MRPVEFDLRFPVGGEEIRRNVEHALSLGLPDLLAQPARGERLSILANGPTALDANLGGPILSLNGSLQLFRNTCRAPTWWAACDPQEMVADFLLDAPMETTYLVASKCHPRVFEALKGRNVLLWHINEEAGDYFPLVAHRNPVMVAPTITLCAFGIGELLGFSRFQTWGWDACYMGGLNHAAPQEHNTNGNCDLEVGPRTFRTTAAWMHEAGQASDIIEAWPRDLIVHGDGMIGAILRFHGLLPDADQGGMIPAAHTQPLEHIR